MTTTEFEPPGPVVIVRLTVDQAVDVFEAYKSSRFSRPRVDEIIGLLEAAINTADPGYFPRKWAAAAAWWAAQRWPL